jgi:hypothetical protein
LRFALALDGVSLALPSAVTIAQLDVDLDALETPPLTNEELAEMRELESRVQVGLQPRGDVPVSSGDVAKAVGEVAARPRVASHL